MDVGRGVTQESDRASQSDHVAGRSVKDHTDDKVESESKQHGSKNKQNGSVPESRNTPSDPYTTTGLGAGPPPASEPSGTQRPHVVDGLGTSARNSNVSVGLWDVSAELPSGRFGTIIQG